MKQSSGPYGGPFDIRRQPLHAQIHYDAVFMPRAAGFPKDDPKWGVYAADGSLIEAAAYRRGFDGKLVGQSPAMSFDGLAIRNAPPKHKYLYGGLFANHFGHFLMGVLARLWVGLREDLSEYKIVCHGVGGPNFWFSHQYIADLLGSIGLEKSNFVNFARPTRLSRVVIPAAACEEEHFANPIYANWGHRIGRFLLKDHEPSRNLRPVYLAKTAVKVAVHGAVNEHELVSALERKGVEIVHPQALPIARQVAIWRDRAYVLGSAGSALHSTILWPSGARIAACSFRKTVHANCGIIDAVNKNKITYTFPETEQLGRVKTGQQNFESAFRLKDPVAAAREMLRAVGL